MDYDTWKTTPPKPRGFNCPKCYCNCNEVEPWGLSEMDGRVYRCPECNEVFTEADALSDAECKADYEADQADVKNDLRDLDDCPF